MYVCVCVCERERERERERSRKAIMTSFCELEVVLISDRRSLSLNAHVIPAVQRQSTRHTHHTLLFLSYNQCRDSQLLNLFYVNEPPVGYSLFKGQIRLTFLNLLDPSLHCKILGFRLSFALKLSDPFATRGFF